MHSSSSDLFVSIVVTIVIRHSASFRLTESTIVTPTWGWPTWRPLGRGRGEEEGSVPISECLLLLRDVIWCCGCCWIIHPHNSGFGVLPQSAFCTCSVALYSLARTLPISLNSTWFWVEFVINRLNGIWFKFNWGDSWCPGTSRAIREQFRSSCLGISEQF